MPNWCENILEVSGEGAEAFFQKNKALPPTSEDSYKTKSMSQLQAAKTFTFNALAPVPRDIILLGGSAALQWRTENWGTKWDPDIHHEEVEEGYVNLGFDTAWGPPTEWMKKVAKQFPHLEFHLLYYEPGNAFAGSYVINNGDSESHDEYRGSDYTEYKEFVNRWFDDLYGEEEEEM